MAYRLPAWRYSFSNYYSYGPIPYASLAGYLGKGKNKGERPLAARVRLRRAGEILELLCDQLLVARIYPGDVYELYPSYTKARLHLLGLVGYLDNLSYPTTSLPQLLGAYYVPFDGMRINRWGKCLNPPVLWHPSYALEDVAEAVLRRLNYWRAARGLAQRPLRVHLRLEHCSKPVLQVYLARFGGKARAALRADLEELGVFQALYEQKQQLLLVFELSPLNAHEAVLALDS